MSAEVFGWIVVALMIVVIAVLAWETRNINR